MLTLGRYEMFERVDMGDFNWISPDFLAFASPQHTPVNAFSPSSQEWAALPKTISEARQAKIPKPFRNVLAHFSERNIGLVVRLNSHLYSSSYFTAMGIQHRTTARMSRVHLDQLIAEAQDPVPDDDEPTLQARSPVAPTEPPPFDELTLVMVAPFTE